MAPRRILVARHGERLDFIDPAWRDAAALPDDPPLTPRGEKQARALGRRLRALNVTSVYVSPFRRCARTGALAAHEASFGGGPAPAHSASCVPSSTAPGEIVVRVEPGLCERLSTARYYQTERGPLWASFDALVAAPDGVVVIAAAEEEEEEEEDGGENGDRARRDRRMNVRVDGEYKSVCPYSTNTDAFPESSADLERRVANTVRAIVERDDTDGDILLVGHVSSCKAMIALLAPQTHTFTLGVPYCCLSVFEPKDGCVGTDDYKVDTLCENSFQTEDVREASVYEWTGGFPKTKYVLMMARGLVRELLG